MKTYLKDCRWGRFLLLRGDMISEYVNLQGEWCEAEVELFQQLLTARSSVIEVGSNIGMHSVPLCKIVENGKVYCYEPQRIIAQALNANIALNDCTNAYVRACAVGDKCGTLTVEGGDYDTPWNYGSFSVAAGFSTEGRFPGETTAETIDIVSLEQEDVRFGFHNVDLIKIDAEGYERPVIAGAHSLIATQRPYLFVENNDQGRFDELHAAILALGYRCYWYLSHRCRSSNFNRTIWTVPGFDVNMLCVPAQRAAPEGLVPVRTFADVLSGNVPAL